MTAQQTGNFIAGAWRGSEARAENRNPSDLSDLIGAYAQASQADLDDAIAAARAAQPLWWAAGIQKRHDVLMAIGTEVMARSPEIGAMVAQGQQIWGKTGFRPLRYGDFLILVQRRSALFHEVIRACKAAGLPIAGADRMQLGAELAVKDLSALMAFLATPEDDLSLAAALRSPCCATTAGWGDRARCSAFIRRILRRPMVCRRDGSMSAARCPGSISNPCSKLGATSARQMRSRCSIRSSSTSSSPTPMRMQRTIL
jgi:hypothetical protein